MITVNWIYLPLQAPKNISHDEAVVIISKAAGEWNRAMKNLVSFAHGPGSMQVRLFFGNTINHYQHPGRIAECRSRGNVWEIEFDIYTRWNKGEWWNRLIGNGNALLSAALHEFGHVLDLPHAANSSYIMHSNIPNAIKMNAVEISGYREYYQHQKNKNKSEYHHV